MREALAFVHWLEEACAGRTEPFEYGRGLFRDELPNVWDLNFLRVERGEPDAQELVTTADELMGDLDHRRVVVDDAALAGRLEPEFPAHGWTVERHLVMEHRRPPEAGRATPARPRRRRTSSNRSGRSWTGGAASRSASVPSSKRPSRRATSRRSRTATRSRAASSTAGAESARSRTSTTLEEHRGRGLASAAVLAALDASLAEGNTLTFLLADADDWPYRLYERLGFETTGRRWQFQRLPA